jgi:CSLREA domain-containing protein
MSTSGAATRHQRLMRTTRPPRSSAHAFRPCLALATLAALTTLGTPANAASIVVDTTDDAAAPAVDGLCSLREAITAANTDTAVDGCAAGQGADHISFDLTTPAAINLAADLPVITTSLAIRGPGAAQLAIDGGDLYRPFHVDATGTTVDPVILESMTIRDGAALGVSPLDLGGALLARGGARIRIGRVLFASNSAINGAGAVALQSSTATIEDSIFFENSAAGPTAAGALLVSESPEPLVVRGSTFYANETTHPNGRGGAIRIARSSVRLERVTISGNTSADSGGGISIDNSDFQINPEIVILDSTITANTATAGDGGGIVANRGSGPTLTIELVNSIVAGNFDLASPVHPDIDFNAVALPTDLSAFFNLVGATDGTEGLLPEGAPYLDGQYNYVGSVANGLLGPFLDALAFNGGPTPTHQPTATSSSLVVDHGFCSSALGDQRGYGDPLTFRRIVDSATVPFANEGEASDLCDIGAFELDGSAGSVPQLFEEAFERGDALEWDGLSP